MHMRMITLLQSFEGLLSTRVVTRSAIGETAKLSYLARVSSSSRLQSALPALRVASCEKVRRTKKTPQKYVTQMIQLR